MKLILSILQSKKSCSKLFDYVLNHRMLLSGYKKNKQLLNYMS